MKNEIVNNGDGTSTIIVNRKNGERVCVLVDTSSVPNLMKVCSTVMVDRFNGKYYAKSWLKSGRREYLHRIVCIPEGDKVVDHINMNPLDNRRENLRAVSRGVNNRNTGTASTNASGFKWVSFERHMKKYRARFTFNNSRIDVGFFDDPNEAYEAAYAKRTEMMTEAGELIVPVEQRFDRAEEVDAA
ncbi:HNH endonuclease [Paenibacillus sp. TC-CSREp1]|uniref:HNH endonuclease n=1 Tax=Paenibacillus sp. TC-CSREp1 TaxID=3410089 RepID=UPI003CF154C7